MLLACGLASLSPASAQQKSAEKNIVPVSTSASPSAVSLPAPTVENVAALPLRQWKSSFKSLGLRSPLTLRGLESEGSIGVDVRRDEPGSGS